MLPNALLSGSVASNSHNPQDMSSSTDWLTHKTPQFDEPADRIPLRTAQHMCYVLLRAPNTLASGEHPWHQ